eukprot:CAMPEP_0114973092 /NCGR_PEP_ID=MMETSP0216-20121206/764_1 /TAXON_ID=223996 /ORGANISM="Protocruzia adherens, Strain Boccale" /LENGTH=867 /DNA_ID=CAMNT_0002333549 /DNA_START=217 /DNA_END=2820 /DNA_ORIENTATION=-
MYQSAFQGGEYVEILTSQSKEAFSSWKVSKTIPRVFEKTVKGYIFNMDAGAVKAQLPKEDKKDLALVQSFLVFQIFVPTGKQLSIELAITDSSKTRRRLMFSTGTKDVVINPLHSRIPINNLKRGIWLNFCIDIISFVNGLFTGNNFRSLDHITLSNSCKLRRIYTLKNALFDLDEDENGMGVIDSSVHSTVPKSMEFPPGVTYTNQLFTLEKVRQAAPADVNHDAVAMHSHMGTKRGSINAGTVKGTGRYQIAFGSRHLSNDTQTTGSRRGLASPGFRREKSQGRVLAQTGSSVVSGKGTKKSSVRGSPSVDQGNRELNSAPVKNFEISSPDLVGESVSHEEIKDGRIYNKAQPTIHRSSEKRKSLAGRPSEHDVDSRSGLAQRYNLAGGDDHLLEDSYDFLSRHRSPDIKKPVAGRRTSPSKTDRHNNIPTTEFSTKSKKSTSSARAATNDLYNFNHQEDVMGWGNMANDNFNYADEANFEMDASNDINQYTTTSNHHSASNHLSKPTTTKTTINSSPAFKKASSYDIYMTNHEETSSGKSTNASSNSALSSFATSKRTSSNHNHHKPANTSATKQKQNRPLASTTTIVNEPGKGYHVKDSSAEKNNSHNRSSNSASYEDEMMKMRTFNNFYVHDHQHGGGDGDGRVETEEIEESLEFDESMKMSDSIAGGRFRKSNRNSVHASPDDDKIFKDSLEGSPEKKLEDFKSEAKRALEKDLDALVDDVNGIDVAGDDVTVKKGRRDALDVIPLHDFDDDDDAEMMAEKIASAGKKDLNEKDFTFRGSLETEHLLKMNSSRPFTPPFTTVTNNGMTQNVDDNQSETENITPTKNETDEKVGMVDLVFDPILKCYYDPKSNEYYEHLEAR